MKKIRILSVIILSIFLVDNAYGQSRFKKIKKINLAKEVKKYEKEGFKYERRTGFEAAIQRTVEKEEESDDEGNLVNLVGVGIETSFDQVSAKDAAGFAAGIEIASQISQQVNQIIERDIVDPGDQNVLKEYVNLASGGTSEKLQRNNLLVVYKVNKDKSYTYEVTAYHNYAQAMKLFNEAMAYQMNKAKAVEVRKKYDGLLTKGLVEEVNSNVSEN